MAVSRLLYSSACGQRPTAATSKQELFLQRAHATGLAGAMVVVAKQVAEAMHSEALKLPVQAGATRAAAGGLHGDHDVAEKNPIARRIGIALNLLHVETQHIGRAIEAAVLAIERSDLVIAGEQQGCRRAHASQLSQGRAQAIRDPAARGRIDQGADVVSDDGIDGHGRDHKK